MVTDRAATAGEDVIRAIREHVREHAGDDPWYVVAADGGARLACALGMTPEVVVGDLDSLGSDEREMLEQAGCRFVVHPVEKDQTDVHLAMEWALSAGFREIAVVCHTSGRLDHVLGGVWAACRYVEAGLDVYFVDAGFEAALVKGPASVQINAPGGLIVSLLPVSGKAEGITVAGTKYPLKGESLGLGESRGISNETTASEASVSIDEGLLLVMAIRPSTAIRATSGDATSGHMTHSYATGRRPAGNETTPGPR